MATATRFSPAAFFPRTTCVPWRWGSGAAQRDRVIDELCNVVTSTGADGWVDRWDWLNWMDVSHTHAHEGKAHDKKETTCERTKGKVGRREKWNEPAKENVNCSVPVYVCVCVSVCAHTGGLQNTEKAGRLIIEVGVFSFVFCSGNPNAEVVYAPRFGGR
jgi:hypothetical protein